jgi:hypothetical protein
MTPFYQKPRAMQQPQLYMARHNPVRVVNFGVRGAERRFVLQGSDNTDRAQQLFSLPLN